MSSCEETHPHPLPVIGTGSLYLALGPAQAVSWDTADAGAFVPGPGRLPRALPSGAVVIEMAAAQVFVRLPVVEDVKRGTRRDRGQAGLADLQLLEVGVNRRVGTTMSAGRRLGRAEGGKVSDGRHSDHAGA